MAHKCFISFKKEDLYYKNKLIEKFDSSDVIDKTLDRVIERWRLYNVCNKKRLLKRLNSYNCFDR